ncbi:MAG: hypothetical protein I8H94_01870 [Rhodobacteraceae bacterium]|nr:hypothetical protein [Paracoccaceae bacterium]
MRRTDPQLRIVQAIVPTKQVDTMGAGDTFIAGYLAVTLGGYVRVPAARRGRDHFGRDLHVPVVGDCGMTAAPKILLAHHLKTLKLPTFLREYDKLARQCAAEGQDHVQFLILSDTVGFISGLPTQLVAAFRATLEEVLAADLILHVRDISHPETGEQAADVAEILASLGGKGGTPMFEIWNKLDLEPESQHDALVAQAAARTNVFAVSALTGEAIPRLQDAVSLAFDEDRSQRRLPLPFAEARKHAWLNAEGVVVQEVHGDEGWTVDVSWAARQENRCHEL